ncbi:MAG TPA: sugar phosphate nucleotidyltransferase, partial [Candidatus Polarisedimenticolaceae bacterium]|nr:sugar phosphate nucleotidyltransferase [Candidatus Polarisedimenticolaceae bacterium]
MTPPGGPRSRMHVVLLAGGSGTRFWPMSRKGRPKQFLVLGGKDSLLRATWTRARRLVPAERIWVVVPRALAAPVRRELPEMRRGRLVLEPSPRDTAPAIALACNAVARVEPRAIVAILPTDHLIRDARAFGRAITAARRAAERGALVCLGVRPVRPATGFGYLEVEGEPRGLAARPVVKFEEKPPYRRARRFVRSGRHLWNAGMFVWRVDRFREELARVAPRLDRALRAGAWTRAPKISVD